MDGKSMIKKIVSEKDGDMPFYGLSDSRPPEITADHDGKTDHNLANAEIEAIEDVDPYDPAVDCLYAATSDGRYVCVADDARRPDTVRANLAWFDADSDEWTVLEFIET